MEGFLRLKIGGAPFVLLVRNLEKYPDTFLAEFVQMPHEKRVDYCDGYFPASKEYYFDRSAALFEHIALLYRNDGVRFPHGFCREVFRDEMKYWAVKEEYLDACDCGAGLLSPDATPVVSPRASLAPDPDSGHTRSESDNDLPHRRPKVHNFTDQDPEVVEKDLQRFLKARRKIWKELSKSEVGLGKLIESISLVFILITVVILFLESFKSIRIHACRNAVIHDIKPINSSRLSNRTLEHPDFDDIDCHRNKLTQFDVADMVCVAWFTFEFFVYCWASPNRLKFVMSPFGIIDIVSVLPVYFEYALKFSGSFAGSGFDQISRVFLALRILRALRVVRILKIARYSKGLQVIGAVFKNSFGELFLVFIYTFILTVFFATLVFYAEFGEYDTPFHNIPVAAWWAIVTLTTLGYGDIVPMTALGKVIAACATMSGVVLLAFPISIIVERFTVLYAEASQTGNKRRASRIVVRKIGKHIRIQRVLNTEEARPLTNEAS